ncbi:DUF1269 domain-containing protein [Tetragenococcus koreensis]|uniref:DUF1269 domain-containing protein n=1 Tax=Tetragenococcus koreensis TaxID=290335 RepID=A0AAN4UA44_9ENTE|nr:DUF1269 domain-containing protein [Tetragenococcus koreensis]AYW44968.1 DUF1269 domain-containing protein [Tetragenococcus koreensis]MCF1585505.1 DUF1269 domain-containing protein [Tetragenococcus koreensis]MCF1615066.1 DUF1269 domain-containing protein [Tetragenococcus koreensis]MCF1619211.1 DUF1269 domain-containing protein [Tetragenococcus koreensis]MCF1624879.1 DUF1269 domain-containing protein [Tetragenococcus koreensis]
MTERVIIMNFEENAQAYQGFSMIKKAQTAKEVSGEQMAVVTHSASGQHQFTVEDFIDFTGSNQTSKGGLIGMMIGILGGPLGILLGWFGGSVIGASRDSKEIREAQTVFDFVGKKIDVGETGLILIADETDNRPLNQIIMMELGGEIARFDLTEVQEEIKKAQEVEETTKANTKQNWDEKHRE